MGDPNFSFVLPIISIWVMYIDATNVKSSSSLETLAHMSEKSKKTVRVRVSESYNRNCSNRVLYAYGHCRHCMQEHRVPGIHSETIFCGSASNHSRKEVNDGSVTAAAFREIRQEEILCPILESSDHNHPLHDDSDDSVYNNIQSQQDEQLRLKTLQGLNSETMQYSDFQDHTGFLPENAMEMPLPPQFQLPSKHSLNMRASNRMRTHVIPQRELSSTSLL